MVKVQKIQRNFERSKPIIQIAIVLIILVLILVMFSSFTKFSTYSLINLDDKTEFVGGEKTGFAIYLTATDPEQFRTDSHYRVQYGRWRFTDMDENLISAGKITLLKDGIYNSFLELNVPYENSEFIAEIVEYQYSLSSEGEWVMDEGRVKAVEEYPIVIKSCFDATDCSSGNLCLGKLTKCEESLCASYGECLACEDDFDCSDGECIGGACYETKEQSVVEEVKVALTGPINKPGQIQDGEPVAQTAPTYLVYLVIIMWAVLGFFIWQIRKKKKRLFK